jgi:predicted nucleotidyltransferase
MNALADGLRRASRDLTALERAWALVGGLAVSVRTEPRFTRDVDLAVVVRDDADAERLIGQLAREGYRLLFTVEQDAVGRLATVRLALPLASAGDIVLDLLFASSGIEPELVAAAEPIEVWPGLTVPVPRVGHLIALKVLARDDRHRPQDAADLRALLAVAAAEELERARASLAWVTARGYHRRKDLQAEFDALLADR